MKNQLESVKALKALKGGIPGVKIVLAGSGESDYESMLRGYIRENGLEEDVLFAGHLDRKRLRVLMHASDVLLHPIKEQGGWLSPFEAICAGMPVIVSAEMTASDIIKKENIGVVTGNYADAVLEIYKNPDFFRKMSQKGRELIQKDLAGTPFVKRCSISLIKHKPETPQTVSPPFNSG